MVNYVIWKKFEKLQKDTIYTLLKIVLRPTELHINEKGLDHSEIFEHLVSILQKTYELYEMLELSHAIMIS